MGHRRRSNRGGASAERSPRYLQSRGRGAEGAAAADGGATPVSVGALGGTYPLHTVHQRPLILSLGSFIFFVLWNIAALDVTTQRMPQSSHFNVIVPDAWRL